MNISEQTVSPDPAAAAAAAAAPPSFRLQRCKVRRWRRADAPSLAQHLNNRRLWLNMRDRCPHPYTLKDAEDFLHEVELEEPACSFAIVVNGEAVGGVSLKPQTDVYRKSASQGVLRKLGFQREGCLRQAALKEGRFLDELGFGLLLPEWKERQQQEGSKEGQ